jgi:hypothetical protein
MVLASCNLSGDKNFEVASSSLEGLYTRVLNTAFWNLISSRQPVLRVPTLWVR